MKTQFWKISATGNDFILINNLDESLNFSKEEVARLCARRTGIGADGLILLNPSESQDFKMKYLNADGGEVEMCGNGTRALTYFYKNITGDSKTEYSFETLNGVYQSEIQDDYVKVQMTELYDEGKIDLTDFGVGKFSYYLNTGVPHCVFNVENLDNFPIVETGRKIRHDSRFANGVNSNFYEEKDGLIFIRTYERGVEDETLACGTGVTAVAVALYNSGDRRNKYSCRCVGGDVTIEIKNKDEIYLCGKVEKIYEGDFFRAQSN